MSHATFRVALLCCAAATAEATARVDVESATATVEVVERAARTAIEIVLRNRSGHWDRAVVLLPVPAGAAVSAISWDGPRTGEGGFNFTRPSVFPVAPRGTSVFRLAYDEVLAAEGNRVDYVLPRGEVHGSPLPWEVKVELRSARTITAVYSASHRIVTEAVEPGTVAVRLDEGTRGAEGPFRLSWRSAPVEPFATVLACPDPAAGDGSGYFMLLAGPPALDGSAPPKEVTLVLDRSGSMAGPMWRQSVRAAIRVLSSLAADDTFNIIDYGSTVSSFAGQPVPATHGALAAARGYLMAIRPTGGTNVYDALALALRQPPPAEGVRPIVLVLTDGLPTIGITAEREIRGMVGWSNAAGRRIFAVGLGDSSAHVLGAIAAQTGGASVSRAPGQDLADILFDQFWRACAPACTGLVLETLDADGRPAAGLVRDVVPGRLPDLGAGEQLVLFGRYAAAEPVTFRLTGTWQGARRSVQCTFDFRRATPGHSFVRRLWASRRSVPGC